MWMLIAFCLIVLLFLFWDYSDIRNDLPLQSGASAQGAGRSAGPHSADPRLMTDAKVNECRFSVRFVPVFLTMFVPTVLGGALMLLAFDPSFDWTKFVVITVLIGLPGSILGAFLIRLTGQLKVNDSGLHDCAMVFGGVFVGWNDMQVAETRFLLILKAVRISSLSTGKRFWLTQEMYRRPDFRECVDALAPANCPLLKYLPQ
jgi:hypothetical protein